MSAPAQPVGSGARVAGRRVVDTTSRRGASGPPHPAPRHRPRLDRATRSWWAAVAGVLVTIVYLFPVYWMAATSVKTSGDVVASPPQLVPLAPTLRSYTHVALANETVWQGIANSTLVATGTTVITLLAATPAAYALVRLNLRFVTPVLLLFLIVQMVPSINLVLPMFAIFSRVNLINTYAGLIVANVSLAIPLAVTVMRPYFLAVPSTLVDAAMLDGCNRLKAFWHVVVPIVRPAIITIGAISFVGAWGEYVFALSLNSDGAKQPATVVLANLAYYKGVQWNDLMAVSTIVALPVVVGFILLQRYIVSGLTEGSVKG